MTIIVAGWGAFVVRFPLFSLRLSLFFFALAHLVRPSSPQIPDSPGFTKVFWLTKEENELSKRRMTRMEKLLQSVSFRS